MNPRLVIALTLLGTAALAAIVAIGALTEQDESDRSSPATEYEGAQLPPGVRAPDFALRNQDGRLVRMRDLRGGPVIVTFLYSNCEETCPGQAQVVKGALNELGEDVPALAIAVDPPRDTPASARSFLAEQRMTGRMDFIVGTREELQPLWKGYAIQPQSVKEEHQARIVIVDENGMQRIGFPLTQATPERVAHDVRTLDSGR